MGSQSSKVGINDSNRMDNRINYMNSGSTVNSGASTHNKFSNKEIIQENNNAFTKDNLINTCFKWTCGGNYVYVTGDFTNWTNHIQLQQIGINEFQIFIRLNPGVYKYKFIVDGEWKFSPDDVNLSDEKGNINNIIDTTNLNRGHSSQYQNKSTQRNEVNYNDISKNNKLGEDTSNPRKETDDNNKFQEFQKEAPQIPLHLTKNYCIEEKEKKVNRYWQKHCEKDLMDIEKTYTEAHMRGFESLNSLPPPPHVILNHLGLNRRPAYNIFTMSQRFKAKYATILFYKQEKKR